MALQDMAEEVLGGNLLLYLIPAHGLLLDIQDAVAVAELLPVTDKGRDGA